MLPTKLMENITSADSFYSAWFRRDTALRLAGVDVVMSFVITQMKAFCLSTVSMPFEKRSPRSRKRTSIRSASTFFSGLCSDLSIVFEHCISWTYDVRNLSELSIRGVSSVRHS